PMNRVTLVTGDTQLTPDQGTTWGSLSIQLGGMQLRNAAATAKAALMEEAAKRLGAKPEDLKSADGVITGNGKRVTYGELIGGKSFALKLDPQKPAKFKDPKDYTIVGKPVARLDIPAKMTGRFVYMQDFRVPRMLHGRVVRPPAMGDATSNVGNTGEARAKDDVKKVSASYDFAIHTHGSIGPSCAVAEFKDGTLTSWSASQATHTLRKQLAQMFGLAPEKVRCLY